ncbi:hypothetical protein STRCR_0970 [Streptococcus criceti HS-6]|uniref:Uncharacterized protein n=1 Tax=Streptococcus criceti HS-6 TaxID=873449 RepID=G5JSS2_STRCG|nr:hypothetical protein STRCR_0970 [Streptococcus criceti HS-6]
MQGWVKKVWETFLIGEWSLKASVKNGLGETISGHHLKIRMW